MHSTRRRFVSVSFGIDINTTWWRQALASVRIHPTALIQGLLELGILDKLLKSTLESRLVGNLETHPYSALGKQQIRSLLAGNSKSLARRGCHFWRLVSCGECRREHGGSIERVWSSRFVPNTLPVLINLLSRMNVVLRNLFVPGDVDTSVWMLFATQPCTDGFYIFLLARMQALLPERLRQSVPLCLEGLHVGLRSEHEKSYRLAFKVGLAKSFLINLPAGWNFL